MRTTDAVRLIAELVGSAGFTVVDDILLWRVTVDIEESGGILLLVGVGCTPAGEGFGLTA